MKHQEFENARALFEAILQLQNVEECTAFFDDLCTIKEIHDLAQRFEVAKMLDAGKSYQEISGVTGASTATISRVSKALLYGSRGYRTILDRTRGEDTEQ